MTEEKIALFIDGENMFHVQKENKWFIDYEKVKRYYMANRQSGGAYFFAATASYTKPEIVEGQRRFHDMLINIGYRVITKEVKIIKNKNTGEIVKIKGNLDVEIVFCMLTRKDDYDTLVLLGGDSDLERAIGYLIDNGKKIIIASNKGSTSRELRNICNEFVDLKEIRNEIERLK